MHIVVFPLKQAANDLVFSDKFCLELRKSEYWTTTETRITASCLIMHNNSCSLNFTMSACSFRIANFFGLWRLSAIFKHCPFLQKCVFQTSLMQSLPIRGWSLEALVFKNLHLNGHFYVQQRISYSTIDFRCCIFTVI